MKSNQPSTALRRFFAGLAEYTFQTQLGVADPPLTDYISDMLMRFVRYDAVLKIRNLSGRRMEEIGEMLVEADARIGDARREIHRHVGDVALFWTGVFPESLRRGRGAKQIDPFVDYCAQGKRAYLIASMIDVESDEEAPSDLLQRLSGQFEMCAYGLREVRRQWEGGEGGEFSRPFLIN